MRSRHLGVRLVRKHVGIKKAHAICDSSMTSDMVSPLSSSPLIETCRRKCSEVLYVADTIDE
jgi:HSP90 family molecular chaperone